MNALREPTESLVTPLLTDRDDAGKASQYGSLADSSQLEAHEVDQNDVYQTTSGHEAGLLFKYSVPCALTSLLQYSFSLTTIFVVGHIGTDELGAVSLATMTANITGYAVYEGLASSLDTLCAQAYGSGKKELVGLHMQRMIVLMLFATLPIGALWLSSGWILAALVPEKDLAILAGNYLRILLASTPGWFIFEAGKRFVQAQGLFNASLFVLLISSPFNLALNYTFVFILEWGMTGAACATVVSNTLLPILLWAYVYFIVPSALECWGGLTRGAFYNWGPMVKLSIPGIIMVEAEWLAFDILTFSTSYISTAHLAAQSVCMTVGNVVWHVPFSTSIAASTRLGNLVGAGSLKAARIATKTYIVIFAVIGLVNATFVIATRQSLPRFFSEDPEVVKIAASVMPTLAAFQISDAFTNLVNGILRGLGRQSIGGYVNLLIYYVVAIPLALYLCFGKPNLGIVGLWTGCVTGSFLIAFIEGLYCKLASWQNAIEEARERAE